MFQPIFALSKFFGGDPKCVRRPITITWDEDLELLQFLEQPLFSTNFPK
jgi:hypothetical protein